MDENKRFSKYAHKKSKTMGLLSCFGLRSKSYNAKKYEFNEDKKDKKKRVSTDSFGVADNNINPQLIEETGGGIHPIDSTSVNDSIESNCQLTETQKNEINRNENNQQTDGEDNKKDKTDEKCPENKPDLTQEKGHQRASVDDNETVADSHQQINITSDHISAFGASNQSHGTDINTDSMDTSELSGGTDSSRLD